MLFSYVRQFLPEAEAPGLLVKIFSRLAGRLQEACNSTLSIYCWLQVEARKIILEHIGPGPKEATGQETDYYSSLLQDAPPEQQWVFRELFIYGHQKEDLARQLGKDSGYIDGLLKESLVTIGKRLT